ncbi:PIN-like domain-containing protein [Longispora urticae]
MQPLPPRRVMAEFPGWQSAGTHDAREFLQRGYLVLDANVLLALYKMPPEVRAEVIAVLEVCRDRLWVPHQAILEYRRNRQKAVLDNLADLTEAKRALSEAPKAVAETIQTVVYAIDKLRGVATKEPTPCVDPDEIKTNVREWLSAASEELNRLKVDYGLQPDNLTAVDETLDELLTGRFGEPYPPARLRELVEEATAFRYPNKIPPGYKDDDKSTNLRRAGDYLVWRQILDHVSSAREDDRMVLLVTNDQKEDWWEHGKKKERRGARHELIQEAHEQARAKLLLRTLDEFLDDARHFLQVTVSEVAVETARAVRQGPAGPLPASWCDPSAPISLMELSHREFEHLGYHLADRMGYEVDVPDLMPDDRGYDFLGAEKDPAGARRIIFEVKKGSFPLPPAALQQLVGAMHVSNADAAVLITNTTLTRGAEALAASVTGLRVIDGPELLRALALFTDVQAQP